MKLIDKAALAANIDARYKECLKRAKIVDAEYWNGKADAYRDMLVVLDTFEVQEVDLDKELESFIEHRKAWVKDNWEVEYNNDNSFNHIYDLKDVAKHFFELGIKASQKGE